MAFINSVKIKGKVVIKDIEFTITEDTLKAKLYTSNIMDWLQAMNFMGFVINNIAHFNSFSQTLRQYIHFKLTSHSFPTQSINLCINGSTICLNIPIYKVSASHS